MTTYKTVINLLLLVSFAACKGVDPSTSEVTIDTPAVEAPPPSTEQKEVVDSASKYPPNKSYHPDVEVIEVTQQNDENFREFYAFKIQNNTSVPLKSFKFNFSFKGSDGKKRVESAVVKTKLGAGDTKLINVPLPMVVKSSMALIKQPYLVAAINLQGKTVDVAELEDIAERASYKQF